jgi:hypothetical protein
MGPSLLISASTWRRGRLPTEMSAAVQDGPSLELIFRTLGARYGVSRVHIPVAAPGRPGAPLGRDVAGARDDAGELRADRQRVRSRRRDRHARRRPPSTRARAVAGEAGTRSTSRNGIAWRAIYSRTTTRRARSWATATNRLSKRLTHYAKLAYSLFHRSAILPR